MNKIKIVKTTVEESKEEMKNGFDAISRASRTQLTDAMVQMACAYIEEIDPSCDNATNFISALAMVEGFLGKVASEQQESNGGDSHATN